MPESLCGACDIAAARVIARTGGGIVAVPQQAVRDGHVMVVSAAHAQSFSDLPQADADTLMALVASAARAAEEASGASKCYVLRIGDKQPHLHFHIVPAAAGDPPLAPHIFGDSGWRAGVLADALPPAAMFDPVFSGKISLAADRAPAVPSRIPPTLVSLALTMLALTISFPIVWSIMGRPFAGPVAVALAFAAGRAADDRMKGRPVRWLHALSSGVLVAAVLYGTTRWLER
jgi:diadenosine tetraphosphate (Ap4A) HIT family hydrolase